MKTTHGSVGSLSEVGRCLLKNVAGLPATFLWFRSIHSSLLCPAGGAGLATRPGMLLLVKPELGAVDRERNSSVLVQ